MPPPNSLKRDGHPTLRYALFEPPQPELGSILITPGFAEHIGRYEYVAEAWAKAGWLVAVHDPRGQGDSGGTRAFVEKFDHYVDDVFALLLRLAELPRWRETSPPLLFGHSMGALIVLLVALRDRSVARALVLSSPFLGQALPTPGWKKALGRWVSGFWPTYTDTTGITGAMLTHDAERARRIDEDPKRLPRVTARWFTETEAAQTRIFENAANITLPLYCRAAGADQIASVARTEELFARLGSSNKQLEIVQGEFHELHQETRRDEHIAAFAREFQRLNAPKAT